MYVLTVKDSRAVDSIAMGDYRFPSELLMENAGRSVVDAIENSFGEVEGKLITIVSGKGNNGGDGIVVARHLYNRGAIVYLILLTSPSKLNRDPRINYKILKNYNVDIFIVKDEKKWKKYLDLIEESDIVVDAIFGTGFKGSVKGFYNAVIRDINDKAKAIVSIDIPSGINGDTLIPEGNHIYADLTVSMASFKPAHVLPHSEEYCGHTVVGDIGIPPEIIQERALFKILSPEDFPFFPIERDLNSHKGDFGHLVILGGSRDKSGAVIMAAKAALRAGAGLVTVASVPSVIERVANSVPEAMFYPLEERDGLIYCKDQKEFLNFLKDKTALVIGPGMGVSDELKKLILKLTKELSIPIIIDADGLNNLKEGVKKIKKRNIVFTPHPGEFERISGIKKEKIKNNRWVEGIEFSKKYGTNLVLKGYKTLICFGDGDCYVNPAGNPGMATGGSGDVLSGILGGILAQKEASSLFESSVLFSVFIHSLAADLAVGEKGEDSLIATDIIDYLPKAFGYLREDYEGYDEEV